MDLLLFLHSLVASVPFISAISLFEIAICFPHHAPVMLAGKWVWVWNWRRCDGGDAARVAARLRAAGCAGGLVKAFDGPRWSDQGRGWRAIARSDQEAGPTRLSCESLR